MKRSRSAPKRSVGPIGLKSDVYLGQYAVLTLCCATSRFYRWQEGDLGALTYFWITGDAAVSQALIRVYVDGESEASLTYQPAKVRWVEHMHVTARPTRPACRNVPTADRVTLSHL